MASPRGQGGGFLSLPWVPGGFWGEKQTGNRTNSGSIKDQFGGKWERLPQNSSGRSKFPPQDWLIPFQWDPKTQLGHSGSTGLVLHPLERSQTPAGGVHPSPELNWAILGALGRAGGVQIKTETGRSINQNILQVLFTRKSSSPSFYSVFF